MFYPGRDWKIILGAFAALNIVVAGFGVYMFLQVQQGAFFGGDADASDTVQLTQIDKTTLTEVIEYYEQKRATFEQYRQSPPRLVDPYR